MSACPGAGIVATGPSDNVLISLIVADDAGRHAQHTRAAPSDRPETAIDRRAAEVAAPAIPTSGLTRTMTPRPAVSMLSLQQTTGKAPEMEPEKLDQPWPTPVSWPSR
jgi:hypothetical protein